MTTAKGRYAANTNVSVERSRTEIEHLLKRFGATGFAYAWSEWEATIAFRIEGLTFRIAVPLPSPNSEEYRYTATGRWRSDSQVKAANEAEQRRRWRAMVAVIKAKIVAIEDHISTVEREFMADMVLSNGQTMHEWAGPQLARGEPVPFLPAPSKELGPGS